MGLQKGMRVATCIPSMGLNKLVFRRIRGSDRTCGSTGAAVYAGILIDDEAAVALTDRANGAISCAGAATNTILIDKICHNYTSI